MRKTYLKKAFTLLEMLVVIGIIGVIVSIGFVSYSTAQKKSRDAKRKNDLKSIQNAFEQYYSICDYKYPSSLPLAGNKLIATLADCPSLSSPVDLITMPSDPLGGSYQCGGTCDPSGYTICPKNLGGGKYLETENCNSTNKSCCISNLQ
ncbi:MAG: prepilin-type N-terminal cleavage/methylation domain-containing protein [Patescibacteria group bacterium]|nr:prepilin-type N-terminal cleavage/methylation domain-containing protein [Patescibacteria group bacterium]